MAGEESGPLEAKPLVPGRVPRNTSPWMLVGGLTAALLLLGIVMAMWIADLQFVTALYVIVQIVTTIGYGDFTVNSDMAKVSCSIYVLVTLVVAAYMLDHVVEAVQSRNSRYLRNMLFNVEESTAHSMERGLLLSPRSLVKLTVLFERYQSLVVATAATIMCLAFGTVFYATYENCTCSYGQSHVQGCTEVTYESCVNSGGFVKTWLSSFYMSVITLTTVGFGDHSPRSKLGRIVAVPWMLFGVASMANWVNEMRHFFFEYRQKDRQARIMNDDGALRALFSNVAQSPDGRMGQAEYRVYTLLSKGLVKQDTLDQIDRLYQTLNDANDDKPGVGFDEILLSERERREGGVEADAV